jgi:5-keto-L-gluconate epimerase
MKLAYVLSTQPTQFQAVSFASDLEGNIARLAELGYDGVELAVRDPEKLDGQSVKRLLNKHSTRVPAIGTGQAFVEEKLSFTDPDASIRSRAIERVESHIRLACDLNALVIIGLVRGTVQSTVSSEQAHGWLVDALGSLNRSASAQNVRMALEPINRYETNLLNTVHETLELIDQVGSDNLGVLFDTFHANIEEHRLELSLQSCGARLFHVHVADSNRWAAGYGHTDFAPIIATLRQMDYDGWLSAEILAKPNMLTAQEQAIRAMKAMI